MNEDARFAFKSEQDVLDQYNALRGRIEPNIPSQFSLLPKAGFEVKLVEPFRAASAPAARRSTDGWRGASRARRRDATRRATSRRSMRSGTR